MQINQDQIQTLPVHSYVKVTFTDGSQPDFFVVRSASKHDGASAGGIAIMGGSNWDAMATWENVEFEVLYSA